MAQEEAVAVVVEIFAERITAKVRAAMLVKLRPNGPVSADIKVKSDQVLRLAQGLIGKTYSGHHPERGHLAAAGSVVKGSGDGPDWRVVFKHPIAKIHRDGAVAHTFPPRRVGQGPYVRRGPGGYTFGPTPGPINHPGSPANPFLINAALAAGLQRSGGLKRPEEIVALFRFDLKIP